MDKSIANAKVRFGLVAQGCISTIETMLDAGYSWKEIGLRINWEPNTAREHYIRYLRNAAKEIEELVDLLRKWAHPFDNTSIKDTPIIIPTKDADRIREIVGGGV